MKKIGYILLLGFASCGGVDSISGSGEEEYRITTTDRDYSRNKILHVDNCQYLMPYRGGVIHLETCPNSIHKN